MSDAAHAFHLLLAGQRGQPVHGPLPLAAARVLALTARAALDVEPIEITEDATPERLLLHPPGARDLAQAHRQAFRAGALLDVPRDMDLEQAARWAAEVLPGPPVELILLGEPEKGLSLATQRALSRRHLVGRLPFARIRELSGYAERLSQSRARPVPPKPKLYVPRMGVSSLETAYQLHMGALRALLEGSGLAAEDLSARWTQPGDLNRIVDEPGAVLLHLDLGRDAEDPRRVGSPALGDAAEWMPRDLRQRDAFLPGGVWWLEAGYALGVPRVSAYQELLDGLGIPLASAAEARLPEAALCNPRGPLAVLGPADLATLIAPSPDAEADAIREATWEARGELMLALAEGVPVGRALAALRAELHAVLSDLLPEIQTPEAKGAMGLAWAWAESMTLFGDPGLRLGVGAAALPAEPTPPSVTTEAPPVLQAGSWSLVCPAGREERVEALKPLLRRRAEQTGHPVELLRPPSSPDAVEAWVEALLPKGLEPLPALTLLGDAEELPFALQRALSRRALVGRLPFTDPASVRAYADKVLAAESSDAQHVSPEAGVYCNGDWSSLGRRLAVQLDAERGIGQVHGVAGKHLLRRPEELKAALQLKVPVILATLTATQRGAGEGERRRNQGAPNIGGGVTVDPSLFERAEGALALGAWLLMGDHGAGTPGRSIYAPLRDALQDEARARAFEAEPEDARPFVAATPAAALASPQGPLLVLGHVDANFPDSLSPSRIGLPRIELLLTEVMSSLILGRPAGEAARRFTLAAQYVREAGSGGRGAARDIAGVDLDSWVLLGDPLARVPGTLGAKTSAAPSAAPPASVEDWVRFGRRIADAVNHEDKPDVTEDPFAEPDVTEDPFARDRGAGIDAAATPLPPRSKAHEGPVTTLCFSAQGALASGGQDGRVWLALPGGVSRVIDEPDELGPVTHLCFSPSGDALLAGFGDGRARLFELDALEDPRTLAGDGTSLLSSGFTASGADVVTVSSGRRVVIWPERARGAPRALRCPEGTTCAALGGDRLALGTQAGDIAVHALDRPAEPPSVIHDAHSSGVSSLSFSESGGLLMSGGRRDSVALWRLDGGEPSLERRYPVPDAPRVITHLSPDGARFAVNLANAGLILGQRDQEAARTLQGSAFGPGIRTLRLLPGGGLALAFSDRSLRLWRGEGAPGSTYLEDDAATVLAVDPQQQLALGDGLGQVLVMPLSALSDPSMPPTLGEDLLPLPPPDPVAALVASLDAPPRRVLRFGAWVASGTDDGQLRIWDRDGEEHFASRDHGDSPVHRLSANPSATFLLSASVNGRIRLTRVGSARRQGLPLQVAGEEGLAVGFLADDEAVTFTKDGRLRLHGLAEVDPQQGGMSSTTPIGSRDPARAAALSPSGAMAVLKASGELVLREPPIRSEVVESLGGFVSGRLLAIDAEGHQIALSDEDGTLRLFSASGDWRSHPLRPALSTLRAAGERGFVGVDARGRLVELLQDGRLKLHHVVPAAGGGLGPLRDAWGLPDGRLALSPTSGGVAILDPEAAELRSWGASAHLVDVCAEPEGTLLCGLSDGRVMRIDPAAIAPKRAPSPEVLEPQEDLNWSAPAEGDDPPSADRAVAEDRADATRPAHSTPEPAPRDSAPPAEASSVAPTLTSGATPIFAPVLLAAAPPPPPEDRVLTLRVTPEEVELDFAGQQFRSANRLRSLRRHLSRSFHDPVAFGRVLRDAVIHDQLPEDMGEEERRVWADRTTRVGLLQALADAATPLRLELLLDDEPSLHEPLWEALMHDGGPLAARDGLPFARRVHPGPPAPEVPEPLRLVAAVCDHPRLAETGPEANALLSRLADIDVDAHLDVLDRGLARLREAGVAEVRVLNDEAEPVTWERLCQALEEGGNALHLVAHGVLLPEVGFHLVMAREGDAPPFVSGAELEQALGHDLRLLVLASCNSALSSGSGAFNSLGAQLARRVPAVVAMQRPLHVESAQLFAQHFYDDLARSGDPALALSETRRVLFAHDQHRHLNNWPVPVLYSSADHGPLFPAEGERMEELGPIPEPTPNFEHELAELRRTLRVAAPHLDAARILQAVSGGGAGVPETLPQDRAALSASAREPLRLNPVTLREYVLSQDPPLEYDARMYRQLCAALNARKHVVLIGPPGTGKTTLAHYICRFAQEQAMCAGLLPTTATADWSTFDTIGGYIPTGGDRLGFRPGVFLRAISEGRWLVIDELNRAEIDKAIGELFTAIAGQLVELPYQVAGQPVRVRPPASRSPESWIPEDARPYDYIVHPGWRILATMNVYDRSSLYAMSFAFMRRFAFVEVGVPPRPTYEGLIRRWGEGLPELVVERLMALVHPETELMRRRGMGPAILRDMLRYMQEGVEAEDEAEELCAEAFLLYGASQLDGLDLDVARALHHELAGRFAPSRALEDLLDRLRELYPAMPQSGWTRRESDG